jgi:hypothetical protein
MLLDNRMSLWKEVQKSVIRSFGIGYGITMAGFAVMTYLDPNTAQYSESFRMMINDGAYDIIIQAGYEWFVIASHYSIPIGINASICSAALVTGEDLAIRNTLKVYKVDPQFMQLCMDSTYAITSTQRQLAEQQAIAILRTMPNRQYEGLYRTVKRRHYMASAMVLGYLFISTKYGLLGYVYPKITNYLRDRKKE